MLVGVFQLHTRSRSGILKGTLELESRCGSQLEGRGGAILLGIDTMLNGELIPGINLDPGPLKVRSRIHQNWNPIFKYFYYGGSRAAHNF